MKKTNEILKIENLTKIYNGKRKAVDNISFTLKKGMILGFIGPNGAGKSTTIKMICGLTKMTAGKISICGYSIQKQFEKAVNNVGGIVENPEMYGYMSGYNNLKFYASLYPNITKGRILEVADIVGLGKRINDKVSKYSLGMKQRLGIAQALLHSPKLIILDEPTNGLDVNGIIEIRRLLKYLAHKLGVAVMVSSHILSEMENLCDEIIIISKGRIEQVKTLEEIQKANEDKIIYHIQVNYPNFAGKLIEQKFGIKSKIGVGKDRILFNCDKEVFPKLINYLVSNKIMIYSAGKNISSLEEEFVQIVNQGKKDTSID